MTKEEAIRKTDYSETELLKLALAIGALRVQEWRNAAEDGDAWEHYENIRQAMLAMRNELTEKETKGA